MNHAVAQRLTRFAEDAASNGRKLDEILAILRPLTTPAGRITTPGEGRERVDLALHAFGHRAEHDESAGDAVASALAIERSRRDEAINEAREARAEVRDLADKLDAALVELAATKAGADKLCSEWPGGPARILTGGVVVLPGTLSTLFRERRRWWGRLRR